MHARYALDQKVSVHRQTSPLHSASQGNKGSHSFHSATNNDNAKTAKAAEDRERECPSTLFKKRRMRGDSMTRKLSHLK
jgi:hypothetical protein